MKHILLTLIFRGVKSIGINLLDHVLLAVMEEVVAIVQHVLVAVVVLHSKVPNVVGNGVQ